MKKNTKKKKYKYNFTKKKKKIYDIVIVGGGVSGLYLYYKLLKNKKVNPNNSILYEKYKEIGGRVQRKIIKKNNIKHIFEAGAGRFNSKHKNLLKLINELKLEKNIIPISGNTKFITVNDSLKKYKNVNYYFKIVLKKSKLKSEKYLQSLTFIDYCIEVLGNDICKYLQKAYAYNDSFKTNAYDAIRLFKKSMNPKMNNFFILNGGLSQITKTLEKEINIMGGNIKTSSCVSNIKYKNRIFEYNLKNKKYMSNKIILTLPKNELKKMKILNPVNNLLNSVGQSPLMRIYAIFKKEDIWFKNMGKMNTDNNLRFIIPINENKGSIMISYGDEEYANYWNNLIKKSKSKKEWQNILMKNVRSLFGENIKDPIWIQNYYWKNGVSYWKPHTNSKQISKDIIQPLKKNNKKLEFYICGSNYSLTNAWMEGGLETANIIYKKMN